ncbi:hypothetical protein Tco_0323518, partial [Tanacetum coccineum]
LIVLSDSSDNSKGVPSMCPSIPRVPIEGPSIQGLLDCIDKDTTDKDITDEDTIYESYSSMSKGKYVPVSKKHNPKVIFKSPSLITRCVLGLANVHTEDDILKKFGVKRLESCADKAKGKIKVSYGS